MLTVCLNGSRPAHDRVPVTVAQVAASAAEAVAAGADAAARPSTSCRSEDAVAQHVTGVGIEEVQVIGVDC